MRHRGVCHAWEYAGTAAAAVTYVPTIGSTSYDQITLASGIWYNFTIQAHPKLTRENNSTFKFSQMPYDLDKVINEPNAKFVRCYDTTTTNELSNKNLIRTQKF